MANGPKFCRNCGTPLNEGVKFCAHCGQQIRFESTGETASGQARENGTGDYMASLQEGAHTFSI